MFSYSSERGLRNASDVLRVGREKPLSSTNEKERKTTQEKAVFPFSLQIFETRFGRYRERLRNPIALLALVIFMTHFGNAE